MGTWAPSPPPIPMRDYCIMRKDRGSRLTCEWSLGSFVAPFLVSARTGPKYRAGVLIIFIVIVVVEFQADFDSCAPIIACTTEDRTA